MNKHRPPKTSLLPVFLLLMTALACAQSKPVIRVEPARVKSGDVVILTGTGFTPNRLSMSHLLKPDGSEYNPLRLRIDARGEIAHKIDTVMLDTGTFEVWIEDEVAKTVSNRIQFRVD